MAQLLLLGLTRTTGLNWQPCTRSLGSGGLTLTHTLKFWLVEPAIEKPVWETLPDVRAA